MRFVIFFLSVFALVSSFVGAWPHTVFAQSAESHFQSGLAAFQKGELDAARAAFQDSLKISQDNTVVLFNLALTEQRLGKNGLAMGLWRKALALDPSYSAAANALTWTKGRLERADIPHEVSLWESFRSAVLVETSLDLLLVGACATFFAAGWLLLRHFGRRRRAILDEKPTPGFPFVATAAAAFFILFAFLGFAKAIDMDTLRGTIIEKKVAALSAPSTSGTELFELYEGLEVIIRNVKDDWVQVTYPGASTGWIPRKSLFTTLDQVASQ